MRYYRSASNNTRPPSSSGTSLSPLKPSAESAVQHSSGIYSRPDAVWGRGDVPLYCPPESPRVCTQQTRANFTSRCIRRCRSVIDPKPDNVIWALDRKLVSATVPPSLVLPLTVPPRLPPRSIPETPMHSIIKQRAHFNIIYHYTLGAELFVDPRAPRL